MSDTETIDISHISFSSRAVPTNEDIVLWDSLSDEEQKAVIMRELDEAETGGIAKPKSMADLIAEARADIRNEN